MLCLATSIQLRLEKNHITTSFVNSKQFLDTDSKGKKIHFTLVLPYYNIQNRFFLKKKLFKT